MASLSETGHAKNVAGFEELIRRAEAAGTAYNPARQALTITCLKAQADEAREALTAVSRALPVYASAVDARQSSRKAIGKLVTRAYNMFRSLVNDPAHTESALTFIRKIRGTGVKKRFLMGEDGIQVRQRSVSQQSHDMVSQHFEQFIEILAAHPDYSPNENDLTIASLRNVLDGLISAGKNVTFCRAMLDEARTIRNNRLYARHSGIIDTARAVKMYVRGSMTPGTPQYKQILAIIFKG